MADDEYGDLSSDPHMENRNPPIPDEFYIEVNPLYRSYITPEENALHPASCEWADDTEGAFCLTHHRWKCLGDLPLPTPPSPEEKFFFQAPALLVRLRSLASDIHFKGTQNDYTALDVIEDDLVAISHAIHHVCSVLVHEKARCINESSKPNPG